MYGKLMSINDELMWKYWTFLTDLPQSQIDEMRADVDEGRLHPMQAKKNLAHAITTDFHTSSEADAAAEGWATQFQQKGVSEDVREVTISLSSDGLNAPLVDGGNPARHLRVAKLLQLAGLAASTGEATRKIAENAVSINGEKFGGRQLTLRELGENPALRLGKKAVRVKWIA